MSPLHIPVKSVGQPSISDSRVCTDNMMLLASAGHGQRKPLKLKQHIPVKSKVKQQLQQADALHAQRGKARKHRLQTALGPRSALLLPMLHRQSPCCWPFCHTEASCGPPPGLDSAFLLKPVLMLPACCLNPHNAAPGCRLRRLS